MTQRNENSVLFSLGHLQQMAMTSGGGQLSHARPLGSAPVITSSPSEMPYIAVSLTPATLMSPRSSWPRWLAPAIFGLGVLFVSFLVLALAVALRTPQSQPVAVPPRTAVKPVAALTPKAPSPPERKAPAPAVTNTPALPPVPPVVETAAVPDQPRQKVAKRTKRAKRRAALRRRRARARARKRRARLRARRRRVRRQRARARRVAARATPRPYARKLGDRELDAILDGAH